MEIETKAEYFMYIKELERMGVAYPSNCHQELKRKFPHLDEARTNRLIDLYIKEELENKKNLLLG